MLHRPVETATQSGNSTIKLCGVSEAQRSERPNERIVMRFEMHLVKGLWAELPPLITGPIYFFKLSPKISSDIKV